MDWVQTLLGKKYSPDQPRVPSGDPAGGRWTSGGAHIDASQVNDLFSVGNTEEAYDKALGMPFPPLESDEIETDFQKGVPGHDPSLPGWIGNTGKYYYHTTIKDALPSIAENGLIPKGKEQLTFTGFGTGSNVSLTTSVRDLNYWSRMAFTSAYNKSGHVGPIPRPALLRVKRDRVNAYHRPQTNADEMWAKGVLPSDLELWDGKQWKPIIGRKASGDGSKYSPDQPREPAGTSGGGQWAGGPIKTVKHNDYMGKWDSWVQKGGEGTVPQDVWNNPGSPPYGREGAVFTIAAYDKKTKRLIVARGDSSITHAGVLTTIDTDLDDRYDDVARATIQKDPDGSLSVEANLQYSGIGELGYRPLSGDDKARAVDIGMRKWGMLNAALLKAGIPKKTKTRFTISLGKDIEGTVEDSALLVKGKGDVWEAFKCLNLNFTT